MAFSLYVPELFRTSTINLVINYRFNLIDMFCSVISLKMQMIKSIFILYMSSLLYLFLCCTLLRLHHVTRFEVGRLTSCSWNKEEASTTGQRPYKTNFQSLPLTKKRKLWHSRPDKAPEDAKEECSRQD